MRADLREGVRAVHLDGLGADAERRRDFLVGLSFRHEDEHFPLAVRERRPEVGEFTQRLLSSWRLSDTAQAFSTAARSAIRSPCFSMKSSAPALSVHGRGHVAVTGEKDDGEIAPTLDQPALEFDPVDPGHPEVHDDDTGALQRRFCEEDFPAGVVVDLKPSHAEKEPLARAEVVIVVDEADERFRGHRWSFLRLRASGAA